MKIPNKFKLCAQTVNVSFDNEMLSSHSKIGLADYDHNKITLQYSGLPNDKVEQTFCHELIHFILYSAGDDCFDPPLHKREYLVDRISLLLHQALDSFEYE